MLLNRRLLLRLVMLLRLLMSVHASWLERRSPRIEAAVGAGVIKADPDPGAGDVAAPPFMFTTVLQPRLETTSECLPVGAA